MDGLNDKFDDEQARTARMFLDNYFVDGKPVIEFSEEGRKALGVIIDLAGEAANPAATEWYRTEVTRQS